MANPPSLPQDPRGPSITRPHEMLDPRGTSEADDPGGAATARGGTPAAVGLVLVLPALTGLWLGWVILDAGRKASVAAAVLGVVGAGCSFVGWRAARASGTSGRGALVCVVLGTSVVTGAVVLLLR